MSAGMSAYSAAHLPFLSTGRPCQTLQTSREEVRTWGEVARRRLYANTSYRSTNLGVVAGRRRSPNRSFSFFFFNQPG